MFLLDVGNEVMVWVGKKASENERKYAMSSAQKVSHTKQNRKRSLISFSQYLKDRNRPMTLPISRYLEGGENEVFITYLSGGTCVLILIGLIDFSKFCSFAEKRPFATGASRSSVRK